LCSGFIRPEKNLSTSGGLELVNIGSRGEHVTPKPLRPTNLRYLQTGDIHACV
jgi:hypothetical protein